ncbi:MAG: hypothetical protein AAF183_17865 [Pseudomonadota bacterium]
MPNTKPSEEASGAPADGADIFVISRETTPGVYADFALTLSDLAPLLGGSSTLAGLIDVFLSSPAAGQRLQYSPDAGGSGVPGWFNVAASDVYDVGFSFEGAPTAAQKLGSHTFTRSVTFPADFAGSQGRVDTNPAVVTAIDVRRNGASIGTITIATDGTVSFATVGAAVISTTAGQLLSLHGPSPADANLVGLHVTFAGSI